MIPIRLLALDLDDTMLRSDQTISLRTKKIIKRIDSKDLYIALASSHVPLVMEKFARVLGLHKKPGFLISNNGALVIESNTGKTIHEVKIEPKIAQTVFDLVDAEGFPLQLYEDNVMYVSRENEFTAFADKQTYKLIGMRQIVIGNFRDMLNQGCYQLMIPGDPMLLEPLEILLKTYLENDIAIFNKRKYVLEILPLKTNKKTAVTKIADKLGINHNETLNIDNCSNDDEELADIIDRHVFIKG